MQKQQHFCEICYETLSSTSINTTTKGHFCCERCANCEQVLQNIMQVQSQYLIPNDTQGETFIYPSANATLEALIRNHIKEQVEVPREQFFHIVARMTPDIMQQHFITFASPEAVVRAGAFSYFEAKNLAKFSPWNGNIALYDAQTQIVYVKHIPGFHAAATMAYCYSIWRGKTKEEALVLAARLESVYTHGSGKMASLKSAHDFISKKLEHSQLMDILSWNTGSLILTALFSSNIITSTLSIGLWSALDLYWYSKGLQSSEQTGKNITTTGAGVVGGTTGTLIGATIGTIVFPGIGTILGGLFGGFAGGITTTVAAKKTLDLFIEDDVVKMQKVFVKMLELIIGEYGVSQQELRVFLHEEIPKFQLQKELYQMYASQEPTKYAISFLKPIVLQVVISNRKLHTKMKALEFPTEMQIEYAISRYWRDMIVTFELVTELRAKQQKRDRTNVKFVFKK